MFRMLGTTFGCPVHFHWSSKGLDPPVLFSEVLRCFLYSCLTETERCWGVFCTASPQANWRKISFRQFDCRQADGNWDLPAGKLWRKLRFACRQPDGNCDLPAGKLTETEICLQAVCRLPADKSLLPAGILPAAEPSRRGVKQDDKLSRTRIVTHVLKLVKPKESNYFSALPNRSSINP